MGPCVDTLRLSSSLVCGATDLNPIPNPKQFTQFVPHCFRPQLNAIKLKLYNQN